LSTKALSSSRDGGIDGGLLIICQRLLVHGIGLLPGFRLSSRKPLLVVAPVGNDRRIEGIGVARQRVLRAEEVTAGTNLADRIQPKAS
jgi:hypothetical protein